MAVSIDELPRRLRERRLERGFTQRDVADMVGVTHFAVSNWEAGRRVPRTQELAVLACVLDVTLDWLLLGRSERRP